MAAQVSKAVALVLSSGNPEPIRISKAVALVLLGNAVPIQVSKMVSLVLARRPVHRVIGITD